MTDSSRYTVTLIDHGPRRLALVHTIRSAISFEAERLVADAPCVILSTDHRQSAERLHSRLHDLGATVDYRDSSIGRESNGEDSRDATVIQATQQLSFFYDDEAAREWMFAQHVELQGIRPIDAIRDGRGAEVLAIIDRIVSGAYI